MRTAIPATLFTLCAAAAPAEVITWTFTEPLLSFDHVDVGGVPPAAIIPGYGPFVLSVSVDSDLVGGLGSGAVTLALPFNSAFPWDSPGVVVTMASGLPGWDVEDFFFDQGSIVIDEYGSVTGWLLAAYLGTSNSSFYSDDDTGSEYHVYQTDYDTYAWDFYYTGNSGSWVRSGGDDLFAAPVELPAGLALLGAALAGLSILGRRRTG